MHVCTNSEFRNVCWRRAVRPSAGTGTCGLRQQGVSIAGCVSGHIGETLSGPVYHVATAAQASAHLVCCVMQALFRPMSMMIPDYALVAEVMLFSEGFEDSKVLSRKMVKLYKLASEQVSQQVSSSSYPCFCCTRSKL
eukprot:GHUV01045461.1.p1 GENE.GHUV01045461.1~~GHUV01045461.1.p1  ORF type:complete len:138 (+),score=32.24 GHUV01045461.1:155-568(+)